MINYNVNKSLRAGFAPALEELLDGIPPSESILRLAFFGRAVNNKEYLTQRDEIIGQLCSRWGETTRPLVSYIIQPPLDAELVVEIQSLTTQTDKIEHKTHKGILYKTITQAGDKQLFTDGILAPNLNHSIWRQSCHVLDTLGEILDMEQMPINSIVRQWNYIEQITLLNEDDTQHYQSFNDARSHFYASVDWTEGYPAATGIGTDVGGIMVEVDAVRSIEGNISVTALDNRLQVAAHAYSQEVLIGTPDEHFHQRTTPKFERAKSVELSDEIRVYISGTAAIRGEDSLTDVGIAKQTIITLENIEFLISKQNLEFHGVQAMTESEIQNFRVYLKSECDLDQARSILRAKYPDLPILYVVADVCRDELLIEIEGVAIARRAQIDTSKR